MGATKLMTAAGGGITLDASSTATDKTITVPADNGTLVYANSSGNVGIGTSSPTKKLSVVGSSDDTSSGVISTSNSNAGTLTQTGLYQNNGTQSAQFSLAGTGYTGYGAYTAGNAAVYNNQAITLMADNGSTGIIKFATGGNGERMRIDTSGNLLVGTTSGTTNTIYRTDNSVPVMIARNGAASGTIYGVTVNYSGQAPNNTTSFFLQCNDTGAERATIRSNGGLANYSANNVNLSDERTKTDIQNAGSYLAKICAIPVRTFKYKDQTDDLLNLGVIAQEVEVVAPELVDVSGFGETPEDGVPLKAVYQTDLQYALMKCIQEQQIIIESLRADVEALKGTV